MLNEDWHSSTPTQGYNTKEEYDGCIQDLINSATKFIDAPSIRHQLTVFLATNELRMKERKQDTFDINLATNI
jgi:hypothetical protein